MDHAPVPRATPSLAERLRAGLGQAGGDRRVGVAVALLLIAAPVLTMGGATWMAARARADRAAVERTAAPRLAVLAARSEARRDLVSVSSRPGPAATLDSLARSLPRDALLASVARDASGKLRVEAIAPDPDRLRAALRRAPALAQLRDAGQRRGDGAMIVVLEDRP